MPAVADWSGIAVATVGGLLGTGSVSLTLTAVPSVHERPVLDQTLTVLVMVVASARAREVVPTTRVRAAVAVVMSVSSLSERVPLDRNKEMTE